MDFSLRRPAAYEAYFERNPTSHYWGELEESIGVMQRGSSISGVATGERGGLRGPPTSCAVDRLTFNVRAALWPIPRFRKLTGSMGPLLRCRQSNQSNLIFYLGLGGQEQNRSWELNAQNILRTNCLLPTHLIDMPSRIMPLSNYSGRISPHFVGEPTPFGAV